MPELCPRLSLVALVLDCSLCSQHLDLLAHRVHCIRIDLPPTELDLISYMS